MTLKENTDMTRSRYKELNETGNSVLVTLREALVTFQNEIIQIKLVKG